MNATPLLRWLRNSSWFVVGAVGALALAPLAYVNNRPDPVRDAARDPELGQRDEIAAQALRCFSMADRFKNSGDQRAATKWYSEGLRLARIAEKGLPTK